MPILRYNINSLRSTVSLMLVCFFTSAPSAFASSLVDSRHSRPTATVDFLSNNKAQLSSAQLQHILQIERDLEILEQQIHKLQPEVSKVRQLEQRIENQIVEKSNKTTPVSNDILTSLIKQKQKKQKEENVFWMEFQEFQRLGLPSEQLYTPEPYTFEPLSKLDRQAIKAYEKTLFGHKPELRFERIPYAVKDNLLSPVTPPTTVDLKHHTQSISFFSPFVETPHAIEHSAIEISQGAKFICQLKVDIPYAAFESKASDYIVILSMNTQKESIAHFIKPSNCEEKFASINFGFVHNLMLNNDWLITQNQPTERTWSAQFMPEFDAFRLHSNRAPQSVTKKPKVKLRLEVTPPEYDPNIFLHPRASSIRSF